jgi:hypothetical protein
MKHLREVAQKSDIDHEEYLATTEAVTTSEDKAETTYSDSQPCYILLSSSPKGYQIDSEFQKGTGVPGKIQSSQVLL